MSPSITDTMENIPACSVQQRRCKEWQIVDPESAVEKANNKTLEVPIDKCLSSQLLQMLNNYSVIRVKKKKIKI